jgi:hypothetical protein
MFIYYVVICITYVARSDKAWVFRVKLVSRSAGDCQWNASRVPPNFYDSFLFLQESRFVHRTGSFYVMELRVSFLLSEGEEKHRGIVHRLVIIIKKKGPVATSRYCTMVNIRQATVHDLLQMQMTNLWCLPENYQVRFPITPTES